MQAGMSDPRRIAQSNVENVKKDAAKRLKVSAAGVTAWLDEAPGQGCGS